MQKNKQTAFQLPQKLDFSDIFRCNNNNKKGKTQKIHILGICNFPPLWLDPFISKSMAVGKWPLYAAFSSQCTSKHFAVYTFRQLYIAYKQFWRWLECRWSWLWWYCLHYDFVHVTKNKYISMHKYIYLYTHNVVVFFLFNFVCFPFFFQANFYLVWANERLSSRRVTFTCCLFRW